MPVTLTYPGVYIVEAPSGVHTITGVATSIGAFFGQAAMGPVNIPVECLSYSDYTRNFGAPVAGANLAQSVQQFFANGGSDCFVVRLASGAQAAQIALLDLNKDPVLQLSAASPGLWGAGISFTVDYNTPTPDSTFNLKATLTSGGNMVQSESFGNLSMDPGSPRYARDFINQSSQLLTASTTGLTTTSSISGGKIPQAGYSVARGLSPIYGTWTDWNTAIAGGFPSSGQGSFQISVDGGPWTPVNLSLTALKAANASDTTTFQYIADTINNALGTVSGYQVAVSAQDNSDFLVITSTGTAKTSVQVIPATSNDIAQALMLGVNQGGIEVALYSDLRPAPNGIFFSGTDSSGNPTSEIMFAIDQLAQANLTDVSQVTINGVSQSISLTSGGPLFWQGAGGTSDHDGVRENLQLIVNQINKVSGYQALLAGYRILVQNLNPNGPQWTDNFSLAVTGGSHAVDLSKGFLANVASYSLAASSNGPYCNVKVAPSDGNPPTQADYIGNEQARTGFYALDSVDLFNIMVIPGDGIETKDDSEWQAIRSAAAVYCQNRRAFLLLDAPSRWTTQGNPPLLAAQSSDVQTFRSAIGAPDINCAVYYPRIQINDNGTLRYIGPSGMIAGVYAATDASRGVWKAPAGTNAALTGVTGLEVVLTDKQNGVLNPLGVNCLRSMPAGYLVWGARTVDGYDNSGSQWTYIPVRRMALFLEESLYRGTQWVVFEPNDEPLWAQIRMNINAFMMGLFKQGAFQGTTPDQAFFVKCDSETTTQADIDQGIVNIIVGFAPLMPAEFVVITIQQIIGNLS
ncbi:conserved hypothetical protein [Syntrophobacter sp. SbD1]|nr:conserved hypothetical protein [Syntrophobacter sp. SbD1]